MQLKSFVIPVLSPERSEGDVNSFLRSHRVLRVDRQFVNDAANAYWAVLVEYAEDGHAEGVSPARRGDKKEDFNLSSDEQDRYNRYRIIRNKVSMQKGVPPYVIFTNQELATLAKIPDLNENAVKNIKGIAPSRLSANITYFMEVIADETGGEPDGADSPS